MTSLAQRFHPLSSTANQRQTLEELTLPRRFQQALEQSDLHPLRATAIDTLQINLGKLCNQTCRHCHVDAGPDRPETMSPEVVAACLRALEAARIPKLDVTGGAPELHPQFREIVEKARALGAHVTNRCNLTILLVGRHEDLPQFFARHRVEVIASLPSYNPRQTDSQRGSGVFENSIEALRRLNRVGYGNDPELQLNLVTNPVGAYLPGNQASLAVEWKRQLERRWGVHFNNLYTITNMPISRFLEYLVESGNLEEYMERLVNSYNPRAAAGVMCRDTLSVGWDGTLYDCDFNQMLELSVSSRVPQTIHDFELGALRSRKIAVGQHCFGCTAGAGSSCGGATADA
jgi:radical SAM/Cys-rich protein